MVGGELVNYESSWGSEVILVSYINSEDIDWIYKTGRWNDFYKRKNNPTVKRMVIKAFNEYEKRIQEKDRKKRSVRSSEESLLCPLSRSDKSLLM